MPSNESDEVVEYDDTGGGGGALVEEGVAKADASECLSSDAWLDSKATSNASPLCWLLCPSNPLIKPLGLLLLLLPLRLLLPLLLLPLQTL